MRYVAAFLLAALGGNAAPSKKDLKKILESVGVSYDDEKATAVCDKLAGKSIEELIAEGSSKMASMPAGGAAPAAGSASGGAADSGDAPAEKKEEKKEETEESDDDMGFGLFD